MKGLELYGFVRTIVQSGVSPAEGFGAMVDLCRRESPNSDWTAIAAVDISSDLRRMESWLGTVFQTEPPSPDVRGFWFGLFETEEPDGTAGCELYVCGSSRFVASEDDFDWAVGPEYMPESGYSGSRVLSAIAREAQLARLPSDLAGYALPLAYAGLAVGHLTTLMWVEMLGTSQSRGIAVGHDEGDAILMGSIDALGWHPTAAIPPPSAPA